MGRSKRYILAGFGLLAIGACAAIAVTSGSDGSPAGIQEALENLSAGRYDLAEQQAMVLVNNPADPVHRAWMIVGAARQGQGQYASAARAYRMFLAACTSGELREYALSAISACQAGANPQSAEPAAPSKRLSVAQQRELAAVEEELVTESTSHFVVRARNAKLAKLVAAEAEASLEHICRVILAGQEYPHGVDIYVWTDRRDYLAHASDAPEWSGGSFSMTARDGAVTRRIDLTQRDERGRFAIIMFDRVLPHELCHLVIKEYFGDAACPLFLSEGLAMLAEAEADNERVILAGTALAGKGKVPLDDLVVRQRNDAGDPAVFYAESFSFAEFLRHRMTERQFREFLEHVKSGCPVSDSLQRAMYLPPDEGFTAKLSGAWEDHAILQAQILRIVREQDLRTARRE
jgi:hypothetical protein